MRASWAVLAVVLLTGCSGPGSPLQTVSGQQRLVGGPCCRARPLAGTVTLTGPSRVVLQTADDGTFRARVRPGTYRVTGVPRRGGCVVLPALTLRVTARHPVAGLLLDCDVR